MNKLDAIRKIKKYKEPPCRKDDLHFLRSPWYKFGSMSCIRKKWYWFADETILQVATAEDIINAYNEITKFYYDKGEDFNMYTSTRKSMFEEVKDRDIVLGSGNGETQKYFRTVKDFVDFLSLPVEEEKLDNIEKRYIKDFVRPFRDDIRYIIKISAPLYTLQPKEQIKVVYYKNGKKGEILLPPFPEKSMYKGMKLFKEYTLEELGIKFGN
jgi:hypothetical protein